MKTKCFTLFLAMCLASPASFLRAQDLKEQLVAQYFFNNNTLDASGKSNNGKIVGGVKFVKDRFGFTNSACRFNGHDAFIEVPDAPRLDLTTSATISVWIYQEGISSEGYRIVDKVTAGTSDGYLLDNYGTWETTEGRGRRTRFIGSATAWNSSDCIYKLNEWHHLVATYDKGKVQYYLDGETRGGYNENTSSLLVNNLSLRIGAGHDGPLFFGLIDDISIYSKALDEDEVKALFRQPPQQTRDAKLDEVEGPREQPGTLPNIAHKPGLSPIGELTAKAISLSSGDCPVQELDMGPVIKTIGKEPAQNLPGVPLPEPTTEVQQTQQGSSQTKQGLEALIIVYPNPTSDYLKVSGFEWTDAFIYNMSGSLVHQCNSDQPELPIQLPALNDGYYIVELSNQIKISRHKILVRH